MPTTPNDLITIKEASAMSGKSTSSVRSWVRQKKITGYKADPNNKNSALLVSEGELRVHLAVNGKITSPNVGRAEDVSSSIAEKDKRIQEKF